MRIETQIAVCVLFLLSVIAGLVVSKKRRVLKKRRFASRRKTNFGDIYNLYYSNFSREDTEMLWNDVASSLKVDPTLLRPFDRFDQELGPIKGFPVAGEMDEFWLIFQLRCKARDLNPLGVRIKTLDDYVKLLAQKKVLP